MKTQLLPISVIAFTLFLFTQVEAAEKNQNSTWIPHEHPALRERSLNGFTEPVHELMLSSKHPAYIAAVHAEVGQIIPENFTAISLNKSTAELQLQQALLQAEQLNTEKKRLEKELTIAERENTHAKKEFVRIEGLFKENYASEAERDLSEKMRDVAEQRVLVAQAAIESLQAQQALAQNSIAQLNLMVKEHNISAPSGWMVVERYLEAGSFVQPGQAILAVVDVHAFTVEYHLSTNELIALRKMSNIQLHSNEFQSDIVARIYNIDQRFNAVTQKHRVELLVQANDMPKPIGGIRLELKLAVPERLPSIRIPLAFTTQAWEQNYVYDNNGQKYQLQVLRRQGNDFIIDANSLTQGIILVDPTSIPQNKENTNTSDNNNGAAE